MPQRQPHHGPYFSPGRASATGYATSSPAPSSPATIVGEADAASGYKMSPGLTRPPLSADGIRRTLNDASLFSPKAALDAMAQRSHSQPIIPLPDPPGGRVSAPPRFADLDRRTSCAVLRSPHGHGRTELRHSFGGLDFAWDDAAELSDGRHHHQRQHHQPHPTLLHTEQERSQRQEGPLSARGGHPYGVDDDDDEDGVFLSPPRAGPSLALDAGSPHFSTQMRGSPPHTQRSKTASQHSSPAPQPQRQLQHTMTMDPLGQLPVAMQRGPTANMAAAQPSADDHVLYLTEEDLSALRNGLSPPTMEHDSPAHSGAGTPTRRVVPPTLHDGMHLQSSSHFDWARALGEINSGMEDIQSAKSVVSEQAIARLGSFCLSLRVHSLSLSALDILSHIVPPPPSFHTPGRTRVPASATLRPFL
jgi:hypothetical protein